MIPTHPVWQSTVPELRRHPAYVGRALHVDVAIIGGGITGLTAALLLKRAGVRVAVLEGKRLLGGATGSTTAHLTQMIDTRFSVLERSFGEAGSALAAASSGAAIAQIEQLALELKSDCGFERVPGFLYTEHAEQYDLLADELDAAQRAGLQVTDLGRDLPLPFPIKGALRVEGQAQFHPRAYLASMAAALDGEGSALFEETPVVEVTEGTPCSLTTGAGHLVRADRVIVATHAPLNRLLLQTKLAHYQTYVVAGPLATAPKGLFWDLDDPYHYLRALQTERGPYFIIGGEDHKTGHEKDTEAAYARLSAYAQRFGLTPTHRWSGQVIESVDGLPYIGHNSGSQKVFVASGFSGNGMTFGTLAAMILSDSLTGRKNPYAELYTATRVKPVAGLSSFLSENIDFPLAFIGGALAPPEAATLAEVGPGEGKTVKVEGKQLAVYRAPSGTLHAVSSVCTHMGCHVRFNAAETSWDCPCHGARFGVDGTVLAGPAVTPLEAFPVDG